MPTNSKARLIPDIVELVKVENGKRVRVRVKLQLPDGTVLEESVAEYFQGAGTMLPGLESELAGMSAGESKSGVIPAERAFGHPQSQPEKDISRSEFPADAALSVGHQFAAKAENGQDVVLRVIELSDDKVRVRLMHPLADKDISFEADILSVTDPAPPPLPADALAVEADDATTD